MWVSWGLNLQPLDLQSDLLLTVLWNLPAMYSRDPNQSYWSGPSCSKLTTSLVNDSLKFTSSDTQICWNFLLKNVSSFWRAKATHIFSAKNIRILYIESAKTVNEMTLNELVKLTTLWTTGPWIFTIALDKIVLSIQSIDIFLISPQKHTLCVFIRSASSRHF